MAKASPIVRAFNAGEFSRLLDGRTDIDRYPSSLRSMQNCIAAVQGPLISRSGTRFITRVHDPLYVTTLIPFEFEKDQALMLAFSQYNMRVMFEDGLQVYDPVAATACAGGDNFVLTLPGHALVAGNHAVALGFPEASGLNNRAFKVQGVAGNDVTFIGAYDASGFDPLTATMSKVYEIETPYTEAQARELRGTQQVDAVYLTVGGMRPRRLGRYGAYDWRISSVALKDGPFMDKNGDGVRLTPSATGNMAADPALGTGSAGSSAGGHAPASAFDDDLTTYWESGANQSGTLIFTPTTPFVCTGYVVAVPKENASTSYASKDYAPGTWTFEGYDGAAWVVLHSVADYVLYDGHRSVFFEVNNSTAYTKYQINITQCTRNGTVAPRVSRLTLRGSEDAEITMTASGVDGVNNGQGFLSTDVGRLVRVLGSDGYWRSLEITSVTSTTVFDATLQGEPLANVSAVTEWRLGYWSDTTGWPTLASFQQDRLMLGGSTEAPDMLALSVTGSYEDFSDTDPYGEVLDESAIVIRPNAGQLARLMWVEGDEKNILIGTSSGTWVLSAAEQSKGAITSKNMRLSRVNTNGSADASAVVVDKQVLYITRGRREIKEFVYVFADDGYKSPSMSRFATHMGIPAFQRLAYSSEPHSLVWVRREDGKMPAMTYNRDENVVGWHIHDFGGVVESHAVLPSTDQRNDLLWLSVARPSTLFVEDGVALDVGGGVLLEAMKDRYIEVLMPFWDFEHTLDDLHYVDSGLRYEGVATTTITGLWHLEGDDVVGLADGVPFGPVTVANGSVTLVEAASNVVVGLAFTPYAELPRIDAGAQTGTALGKVKRIHGLTLSLVASAGAEVGVLNEDTGEVVYDPLTYPEAPYETLEQPSLYTGDVVITPGGGYGKDAIVALRQPLPLPLNVAALMPVLVTQE